MAEIVGFQEWLKGGGANVPPGLQAKFYQDYVKQVNQQQVDQKNQATSDLNTNYSTATNALKTAETADVNSFNQNSPLLQRKLIGNLNARGLGTSMNTITGYTPTSATHGPDVKPTAIYGAGNAQYKNLLSSQASQLGNIQSGYQGLANNLEKQKAGDNINLDSFYSNLAQQRAYARQMQQQQQPGVGDILGLGVGALSLI